MTDAGAASRSDVGECIPQGLNRAARRAYPRNGHLWKTGSDPSLGQFCAVCGVLRPIAKTGSPM